jgi:RNA polymerase sigma-70 factor (ECF subfamily)
VLARKRSFDQLYREHAEALYAYLAWTCGDGVLAEDLLADVFEHALRAHRRFDPRRGSEATWLYAIAVNRVRDHGRRVAAERRAVARLAAEVPRSAAGSELSPLRDDVADALQTLSDEERQVVALRFGADLPVARIAAVLGEPQTTVEARLYRGLRKLRRELAAV